MKKTVVASLAAAMVMSIAGTSFAAANPFVDVPAKHWSYDSVTKLAQAGIVDGYADGKFQGDKVMSRYEMAQIVAKAMAKSDKADAKQKAAIDKLAAEYATELNTMGVRVAALEKNASNLKFTGDVRIRWNNTENQAGSQQFKDRFRLNITSQINDKTSLYARFVFADDKFNQDGKQRLSDLALTTKGLISNTDVTVGRYTLNLGPTTYLSGTTGDIEGITTKTKADNFGLLLGYGQVRNVNPGSTIKNNLYIKNIAYAEATYTAGKVKFNADYFKNVNVGASDGNGHVVANAYKIAGGGVAYTFDSNVKVIGEYYKNSAAGVKLADGSSPTATIARVAYKGAAASKPGSWGASFEYDKMKGNALPYGLTGASTLINYTDVNASNNGIKSYAFLVDYTLAKNVVFNGYYQFGIKDAVTGVDAPSKTFTRAQINYMF